MCTTDWRILPLEEDFFLRTNRHLVPVEVKVTHGCSKSLRILIASEHYPDIAWGVKLVLGNIGFDNSILTLPLSTAFSAPPAPRPRRPPPLSLPDGTGA